MNLPKFLTKFSPKEPSKQEEGTSALMFQINLGTRFYLIQTIFSFWTKFPGKDIPCLTEKT